MSNLRQAAQQAFEVLLEYQPNPCLIPETQEETDRAEAFWDAIDDLRAALAEPVQNEPLAWFRLDEKTNEAFLVYFPSADGKDWRPLYAMPRKPLTNEEISAILDDTLEGGSFFDVALAVARAIERAHGIGEQHGS